MKKNNLTFKKISVNNNKPVLSNEEIKLITNQLSRENWEPNDQIIDLNNFVNNFITEYHNKFVSILAKEKEISFQAGLKQARSK